MVDVSSQNKTISIKVSSSGGSPSINATPDMAMYYSEKSREWAISDRLIENKDYSSKTYATQAKAYAEESKMYSESANLDLENVQNKLTVFDETLNMTFTEGLENIDNAVISGLTSITTYETNALSNIETNKTNAISDVKKAGDDVIEVINENGKSLPMFAVLWADHLYNDASYLRADTFSWHSASIYVTAYEKLLSEYTNENCVEETENGVTYKRSPNGFKIADVSQHANVLSLYENGEKSWYYIIDVDNKRFKLPREKNESSKYLYFYVGDYERPETEVNIGILTELANGNDLETVIQDIRDKYNYLTTLTETSGEIVLVANKIYSMVIDADTTFSLPKTVDTNYFNQIKVMVKIVGTPVITWGTTYFINKSQPELEEGFYDFYFDYDNNLAGWVVGAVVKGV